MAYVPQHPVLGLGSARDWLEGPFAYRANRRLEAKLARLPALLDGLGLPEALLDEPAAKLSGGETQRLALVSALLLDRSILLLDEPTAALDASAARDLARELGRLSGCSILVASHDPNAIGVDRVVSIATDGGAEG
jgi:ATPase subunit of ABC transporter with duplicated ATPase domains